MYRSAMMLVVALAVGCAPSDEPPPGSDEAQAPTAGVLEALSGEWVVTGLAEASDSVLITYDLHATSTSEGWTTTLPDREPMAVRVVAVEGDSVVTEAGPFESALRPGVMVTTRSVMRLQDGALTGTIVARYASGDADSVLIGRLRGVRRAP